MPALRLRSGQAPAGIQGEQAAACGYSAWIPAFAGMTQHSSTPQNHRDRLLVLFLSAGLGKGRPATCVCPVCVETRHVASLRRERLDNPRGWIPTVAGMAFSFSAPDPPLISARRLTASADRMPDLHDTLW